MSFRMDSLLALLVIFTPAFALADDPPNAPAARGEAPASTDDDQGIGINVDVGLESAYVFRGLNVFQHDSQMDQTLYASPSLTWSLGSTGVSVGYWGAYQLTGDGRSENLDAGLGGEQDLIATYDLEVAKDITLSAGLVYYFYPFADEDVAGVSNPSFLEPSAGIGWESYVDVALTMAYFAPVQDELSSLRYFYINPSVGKTVGLSDSVQLEPRFGFGYKIFGDSDVKDNKVDLLFDVGVPIATGAGAYLRPLVGVAWTNFEEKDWDEEVVLWGGLHVGVDL